MKTMVRNTAKSLIIDRTYIAETHKNTHFVFIVQKITLCMQTVFVNEYFNLTRVGKYLLVLNCFRKVDRKKVLKNKMADQKSTSGV